MFKALKAPAALTNENPLSFDFTITPISKIKNIIKVFFFFIENKMK